jgi:hypothetical protein
MQKDKCRPRWLGFDFNTLWCNALDFEATTLDDRFENADFAISGTL